MSFLKDAVINLKRWLELIIKFISAEDSKRKRWLNIVITAGLAFLLVLIFPNDTSLEFSDLKEGSISIRRIVAPFSFEILKTQEEYSRDCDKAKQKEYKIFIHQPDKVSDVRKNIDDFFKEVFKIRENYNRRKKKSGAGDSLFTTYPVSFSDSKYRQMLINPQGRIKDKMLNQLYKNLIRINEDIMAVGMYNISKEDFKPVEERVVIYKEDEEVIRQVSDFFYFDEVEENIIEQLTDLYSKRNFLAQLGYGIISFFMEPNIIFADEIYKERIDNAVARIPRSSGFVKKNEKIVDRNERITKEIRKKLVSLAAKKDEIGIQSKGIMKIFPYLGRIIFVFMLFFLFASYIYFHDKKILDNTKLILLMLIVIFLISVSAFVVYRFGLSGYLVPVIIFSILLTTIFDTQIGFAGTVFMGLLVGGLCGNEFNLTVVSIFMGLVGVIVIHRVRGRRHLVQSLFLLAATYIVIISMMGFLHYQPFSKIVNQWPYGVIIGFFAPIVTYGLLPLIESIFNVTTDFSLLELSNLNHPLLKKLSVKASGTYHHSIIVGNLAESAAQELGANSLLARVGSYYHDIGKLEKPEYFIENQLGHESPHDKLTPRMSALVLKNHVKKGLELADKYKIPSAVKDIIVQHHGSNVMKFFYDKALSMNNADEVSIEDYSYTGLRPQTKESAIVMLADTVEAATKSLKKYTHSRLKGMINKLVDMRFQDGELDESPLTMRDLEKIKESFLIILAGTFHTRLDYAEEEKTGKN